MAKPVEIVSCDNEGCGREMLLTTTFANDSEVVIHLVCPEKEHNPKHKVRDRLSNIMRIINCDCLPMTASISRELGQPRRESPRLLTAAVSVNAPANQTIF